MLAYLARRLAAALIILLGVSVVTFCLTYLIPADPIAALTKGTGTAQTRELIRISSGSTGRCPNSTRVIWSGSCRETSDARSPARPMSAS